MANENIGIMEGAFFVSKSELISWLNDLLSLNISKVEQMASGAAYCQILDIMYPGMMPMSKVNWNAKYEHEFVNNYKLVQSIFEKQNIHKHIDVEKLIKAKYQDNLEFFQWFKRFFDLNCGNSGEYHAVERRKGAKTPWDTPANENNRNKSNERAKCVSPKMLSPRSTGMRGFSPKAPLPAGKVEAPKSNPEDLERIQQLEKQVADIQSNVESAEKEREFYFSKLRTIEIYCDYHELVHNEYLMDIQKILFASENDKIVVTENGSISIS